MTHAPKSAVFTNEHIPDAAADPDTQVDGLGRLTELARNASLEARARLEHTITVVAQARRIRSMTLKTIQQTTEKLASAEQGTLLTEVHNMDEERRSLAELHILQDLLQDRGHK